MTNPHHLKERDVLTQLCQHALRDFTFTFPQPRAGESL